jgi:SAM-dependent methyltransferase
MFEKIKTRCLHYAWVLGFYLPPDRKVLEEIILPYYARKFDRGRVLFVGVRTYVFHYKRIFKNCEYTTMDKRPSSGLIGVENHVVDRIENLGNHFPSDHFDLIVMNGVIGWGLNDEHLIDKGLEACFERLKPGGELLVGVNEELATTPDLSTIKSLNLFTPTDCPPLATHYHKVQTPFDEKSHSYFFFKKPDKR